MRVCDERRRSASSATTRSFSDLSIESPLLTTRARTQAGSERQLPFLLRLGWTSASRLPTVFGVRLRGYGFFCRCSFQFLHEPSRLRRVDVDPGAHCAGQCNRLDVAPFRGRGLRAHDLVDQRRVVLDQLTFVEARLADRYVDVGPAVGAVLELAGLRLL